MGRDKRRENRGEGGEGWARNGKKTEAAIGAQKRKKTREDEGGEREREGEVEFESVFLENHRKSPTLSK